MTVIKKKDDSKLRPAIFDEAGEGQLTVDVYQEPDEFIIQSTVAGVKPEDLEINVTEDMATIRGRRVKSEEIADKNALYQECFWGEFSRTIILPSRVDPEGAKAALKNGILTIHLPKLDKAKTKQVGISL